ncbi:MAG: ABC transporter ATP-binding protein [Verrucomicrobia bacterium]|nr:ABC transporter ATP-binding protein [Verrucomicrobiota bacterium]
MWLPIKGARSPFLNSQRVRLLARWPHDFASSSPAVSATKSALQPSDPKLAAHSALAVECQHLTRRFGKIDALAGVSLNVRRGEFFTLLGPSGCGKTTLLRIIAGLDLPDSGGLRIGGVEALPLPAWRRPVNTVFQSYALFPHLSVSENIAFGLRMQRLDSHHIVRRTTSVMELTQIMPLAGRHPNELSGGQKQRVALARAIVNEPEVLLLDEPLGALDLKLRKELQLELQHLQKRLGITFIHVTHDQDEAMSMSDRIAVMSAGRVEQLGTPEELYEQPKTRFVAQFIGACNLFDGKFVSHTGNTVETETPLGLLRVELSAAGIDLAEQGQLSLGIRPERISLTGGEAGDNRLLGRVEEVIFNGAETHYRVTVDKAELRVTELNSGRRAIGLFPGDSVEVSVPPRNIFLLEG